MTLYMYSVLDTFWLLLGGILGFFDARLQQALGVVLWLMGY